MERSRVKNEFPHYQMSDLELADSEKRRGFEKETHVLEAKYPQFSLKPTPLKKHLNSKVADLNLESENHQDPEGDIRWTYDDRSDLGGRGHFAFRNIKPGELVLRVIHPFVSVPDTPRLSDTCSNCFLWEPDTDVADDTNDQVRMRACVGCRVVKYCGKKCQAESWKGGHKYECKIYSKTQRGIFPSTARLLLRLLLSGRIGIQDVNGVTTFGSMESHVDDFEKNGGETWETVRVMAKGIKEFSGTSLQEEFLLECIAKVLVNTMTLVSPTFDPVGTCLDPIIAGLNHACDFNAVVSFDGPSISVRTLREIKRGEEVTISYIDTTNPVEMRQSELKKRYFFVCQCGLCKKGQDSPRDAFLPGEKDMKRVRQVETTAFRALDLAHKSSESKDPLKKVKDLEEALKLVHETEFFPVYRQPSAGLRQQLIGAYLSTQKWVPALAHALKQYFYVDPEVFPEMFHPLRVVHTWVLVSLISYILGEVQSEPMRVLWKYNVNWGAVLLMFVKDVADNMGKSHGDPSRFASIVRKKERELTGGRFEASVSEELAQDQWKRLRLIAVELAPI